MEKMFIYVLDRAMSISVVIIAVILARFVLRRAPRWIVCVLWAVVAIRLIVPVSVESPFSLVPDTQPVQTRMEAAYVQNSGKQEENSDASKASTATVSDLQEDRTTVDQSTNLSGMGKWLPLVIRGTEIVWLIGIGVLFAYAFGSYLRMRRKVAAAYRIEDNVYVCDEVASPFILGILRPQIYLPSGMDEDFCECVLAHEKAHLMRRDHLWKPLGYLLLAIYWFHPLCWIAYVFFCKDIEVACDERATSGRTNDWKATYCQTLLFAGGGKRRIAVSPVAFGEVGVRERVKSIVNYKKPTPWILLLAAAVVVVILMCFMTNPGKSGHPKDAQTLAEFGFSVESLDTENEILRLRDDLTDEVYSFGLLGTNENFDDMTGNLVDREDYVQADPTIYQSRQAYLIRFGRKDGIIWLESGSGLNSDLALCVRYDLQEDSAGEADEYIYLYELGIEPTYFYEDTECSISVEIPTEWKCKTVENYVGDEKTEGLPDCGVEIYTEDSVTPDIYIFRQVGKIAEPTEDVRSSTAFANVNGLNGIRYELQDEGRVSELIIMDNAFYGISITMDSSVYEQNKQNIESVLESVVIQTK